jgi:hypothetical protein
MIFVIKNACYKTQMKEWKNCDRKLILAELAEKGEVRHKKSKN